MKRQWLEFFCPACKTRLRLPAADSPEIVACTRCGHKVRLARPAPAPRPPEDTDDEAASAGAGYAVRPAEKKKRPLAPIGQAEERDARAQAHSDDEAAPAGAVYAVRPAEKKKRLLPPIGHPEEPEEPEEQRGFALPLWLDVLTFPWHPRTLRAWVLFGTGLALVALAGCGIRYLVVLYETSQAGQGIFSRVMFLYIKVFVVFLFWTGAYAADYLLAAIQDTAAGIDAIQWPEDSLGTRLLRFLYLAWIAACAVAPIGLVLIAVAQSLDLPAPGWLLLVPLVFVYPVVLLSALANDSMWLLLSWNVLLGLLRKPHMLVVLPLFSMLLFVPAAVLGYVTIADMHYELTPVTGLVWSAALLAHARLLGRVGDELTMADDGPSRGRRPPRRRKRGD